jgi:hypothetical protein
MQFDSDQDGNQGQRIIQNDIERRENETVAMPIRHRLECERRERRKATAKSRRSKQPPTIMCVISRPSKNVPDREGASDIYEERPKRKTMMLGHSGGKMRNKIAGCRSASTAEHYQQESTGHVRTPTVSRIRRSHQPGQGN